MKTLYALGLLVAGAGGAALGTRVPEDTHEVRHVYVTRPDARVAPLLLRVGDLERELRAVAARPPGLDGPDVRALFEVLLPPPPETPTTEVPE